MIMSHPNIIWVDRNGERHPIRFICVGGHRYEFRYSDNRRSEIILEETKNEVF